MEKQELELKKRYKKAKKLQTEKDRFMQLFHLPFRNKEDARSETLLYKKTITKDMRKSINFDSESMKKSRRSSVRESF